MKARFGNCIHGLSLDITNEDCCQICTSPKYGVSTASPVMRFFDYHHLPGYLQDISKSVSDLANFMDKTLPDCEEKSVGLRKLLEAKDCFVRVQVIRKNP